MLYEHGCLSGAIKRYRTANSLENGKRKIRRSPSSALPGKYCDYRYTEQNFYFQPSPEAVKDILSQ